MILACQSLIGKHCDVARPWLVFIHGLLGSGADWAALHPYLQDWRCLFIDLPGHGANSQLQVRDFAEVSHCLRLTLQAQHITDYWLVGYSLGGRIALYHACHDPHPGLLGVLVEGSHPGLMDDQARQQRAEHDNHWAQAFISQPPQRALDAWYQQAVFADLSPQARQQLVDLRSQNCLAGVAAMLRATSLSCQPDLRGPLQQLPQPVCWLCGEYDQKFQHLAQQSNLPLRLIAHAGHNAHRANPAEFAKQMMAAIFSPVLFTRTKGCK
jgi:2-succinyl-6-hydroxy-2,4-cyclohexadiene-1-carboxylate synthase